MTRYAAFLRGVMPTNCKMADLRGAFEAAGFGDVKTVLGSGNVVFDARTASGATLEKRAEAAMAKHLGRAFLTFVRTREELQALLDGDPWKRYRLEPGWRRLVTFLRTPGRDDVRVPRGTPGCRFVAVRGREALVAYAPGSPEFMKLIEDAFGKEVTTRTWETVTKVAR